MVYLILRIFSICTISFCVLSSNAKFFLKQNTNSAVLRMRKISFFVFSVYAKFTSEYSCYTYVKFHSPYYQYMPDFAWNQALIPVCAKFRCAYVLSVNAQFLSAQYQHMLNFIPHIWRLRSKNANIQNETFSHS